MMHRMIEGSWKPMFRILKYQKSKLKTFICGTVLAGLEFVLIMLNPELNRLLVQMTNIEMANHVIRDILLIFALFIALSPLIAYGKYLQTVCCAFGLNNLRAALFSRLQRLDTRNATEYQTGDMLTRLVNDADDAANTFHSYGVTSLIRFFVVTIGGSIILFVQDWRIALFSLVYAAVTLFISSRLNPYVKKLDRESKKEVSRSATYLIEASRNIFIIRIFLLQKTLIARYLEHCRNIFKLRVRSITMSGIAYGIIDFFVYAAPAIGFASTLLFGLVQDRGIASSVYIATIVGLMGESALDGSTFLLLMQSKLVSAQRVLSIIEQPIEKEAPSSKEPDILHTVAIKVADLEFAYNADSLVIKNISMSIIRGEHIALVGGSGGGKSTLIKLLASLIEPDNGHIDLFDISYNNISLHTRRSMCAYVPQESTMFDCTIEDNIRFGRLDATFQEIERVSRLACVHDFIMTLPQGYATRVGESGSNISGGQRQRIAIARALLKNAPIILFDEATSALDSVTEEKVLDNIRTQIENTTTIMIAHRLSTIVNSDNIYVIDEGTIAESGTHEKLYNQNGRYRSLWDRSQSASLRADI